MWYLRSHGLGGQLGGARKGGGAGRTPTAQPGCSFEAIFFLQVQKSGTERQGYLEARDVLSSDRGEKGW